MMPMPLTNSEKTRKTAQGDFYHFLNVEKSVSRQFRYPNADKLIFFRGVFYAAYF